jgi:hypothetical protein
MGIGKRPLDVFSKLEEKIDGLGRCQTALPGIFGRWQAWQAFRAWQDWHALQNGLLGAAGALGAYLPFFVCVCVDAQCIAFRISTFFLCLLNFRTRR